ncbi:iron dicitrate transport regulator FecR [Sphingobium sp. SCG-1]|uniref:FecR family protein n=1 Tax=Sphingobium sp. SCG-1 TaxID=2072936 RepID=UPI000CD6A004|nr:FecR domain-containing protein [Sphingobium sp. SCG-1]AUW57715.1 iron dicitrate transport regulator FecR [Sphingobium sp. SCG-1]
MTGRSADDGPEDRRPDIDALGEAAAWQVALEREDADWDGYTAWLEADPRHRTAFNALELTAAAVQDHREALDNLVTPVPSASWPEHVTRHFSKRIAYGVGISIAAALALIVAIPALWPTEPSRSYQSASGERRVIELAGGVQVILSPSTRILVHGSKDERIELTNGEAYFDVKHDPARTLRVTAGDYRISDIGTRFAVNYNANALRIGVSEGTVAVSARGLTQDVKVDAGHQLFSTKNDLTLSTVAISDVGSWRSGRLSYSDAPLGLVVADVSRYSGRTVRFDPSLEDTHFSGNLVIGDGSRLVADLATIMGVKVVPEKDGMRLRAGAR